MTFCPAPVQCLEDLRTKNDLHKSTCTHLVHAITTTGTDWRTRNGSYPVYVLQTFLPRELPHPFPGLLQKEEQG